MEVLVSDRKKIRLVSDHLIHRKEFEQFFEARLIPLGDHDQLVGLDAGRELSKLGEEDQQFSFVSARCNFNRCLLLALCSYCRVNPG